MDPELPKTLTSTSDASSKLAASLDEFIKRAAILKADLGTVSAALAIVHRNVLSQPPEVLEPAFPMPPVQPKPVAAKPVEKAESVKPADKPHS